MERLAALYGNLMGIAVVLRRPLEVLRVPARRRSTAGTSVSSALQQTCTLSKHAGSAHAPASATPRIDWLDQVEVIRRVHPKPWRVERATDRRVSGTAANHPRHFELGDSLDSCWHLANSVRHPAARWISRIGQCHKADQSQQAHRRGRHSSPCRPAETATKMDVTCRVCSADPQTRQTGHFIL